MLNSQNGQETISWHSSRPLKWEDFQSDPDTSSDAVALTASGITFGYSIKTNGSRIIDFNAEVEAHFYPKKSWYLKEKADDYILRHEQLHFDITELYARKFRQQLVKIRVSQNVKSQLEQLHKAINEAVNETQKRYDDETKHSINVEMQKQWEKLIAQELDRLKQYSS